MEPVELDPDDFGDFSSAFATTTVQERELDPSTVASDVVGDGTILNPCDAVPLQAPESSPYTLDWEFADFSSPLVHSNGQFPDIPSLPEDLVFLSGTRENFDSQTASKTCAVLCLHGHEESLQHTKESDTSVGETYLDVSLSHNRSHPTCTNEGKQDRGGREDDKDWGDFGSFETAAVDSASAPMESSAADTANFSSSSRNNGEVFTLCFECPVISRMNIIVDTSIVNFSLLSRLHKSIDFTVPLCKWPTSYLQACYFSSIKVDPVLVPKVDMTSLPEMAQLPTMEGQSAAVDLMESFGFEGAIGSVSPTDPDMTFLAAACSAAGPSGPTLLDLSLPNSPSETLQEDSFTLDADLQGLELHSTEKTKRPSTSIEQLALNEKLVINRTTWVDSELEQLGDHDFYMAPSSGSQNDDQNKEVDKKASFQEQLQQLGLDTSKTTFTTADVPAMLEMSISARLVLDRLPNLSFMLEDTLVAVDHHYYQVGS